MGQRYIPEKSCSVTTVTLGDKNEVKLKEDTKIGS